MLDPLQPLDDYIAELSKQSKGGRELIEVWDIIDRLLEIRHAIQIPEFVLDGDEFAKLTRGPRREVAKPPLSE